MIRAIIFDCFGVVISDALESLVTPLREQNPNAANEVVEIIHAHNRGLITPEDSNGQVATLLGMTTEEYQTAISTGEVKDQQLLTYIKGLRANYKTAMLSNIDGAGLRGRFQDGELDDAFDLVVASGDIGYAKPEARAYEIAAEQLGVRLDECIFTDDRQHYCDGAQAVGMRSILYENLFQFRRDLEALL